MNSNELKELLRATTYRTKDCFEFDAWTRS